MSRFLLRGKSRHLPSWLIFDVRQKMSAPLPRALSTTEFRLADWLLEHSTRISADEKMKFRSQLTDAVVSSRCGCGCATIEFSIGGQKPAVGGLRPLSESATRNNGFGIFIYETGGLLSGLEIYGLANLELPSEFPPLSEIEIR